MSRSYDSEVSEAIAQVVVVHGLPCVVDDNLTTLALRQSPIDDIFAERTASVSDMTMTITGDVTKPAAVVDVNKCDFRVFEIA